MPQGDPYDLIVIGGGINGTGVARDAALRGMRVLLLEKNDFGAGTSAHSSRLIHGGLRYLAHLEFDLVYESLRERERLLRNAPHLVQPLEMVIPLYQGAKNPPFLVMIGLRLYDAFAWGKRMPDHRLLGRKAFLERYPSVNAARLLGGAVYFDAQANFPERLCVENALSALETGHAELRNHTEVTAIRLAENGLPCVAFRDRLTGREGVATAQVLINAAGPWVDDLLRRTDRRMAVAPNEQPLIGGTKGSHIVVRRFPGAPATALYAEAQSDGRPFFIIPWRQDYYLIGTTDLHFDGNPDHVSATMDEVAYLLAETNAILPDARLTPDDVLYTYSGIRPLPHAPRQKAGKITRKHLVRDHASDGFPRLLSLIGGKLTTYRRLAEQTVDAAICRYRLTRPDGRPWGRSVTGNLPLPGAAGMGELERYVNEQTAMQAVDLPAEAVAHLIRLYGVRYRAVLALCKEEASLKAPLTEGCADLRAQVRYAVRTEMARTVADVLLRRLCCGLNGDAGLGAVEAVAQVMADELGWSEEKRQEEVAAYRQLIGRTALAFKK
ncbi:MAG TPA: glycerol-3-phosphate dehydrogenase [Oculatellaceae cyanobacterium]|jgi:glycerol-3-phosphate dehydrogenase